jgi:hypothetical protein
LERPAGGFPCGYPWAAGAPVFSGQVRLVLVVGGVDFDELLGFVSQFVVLEDGLALAGGDSGAAVDAGAGIDVELGNFSQLGLVGGGVDGLDRADIDAEQILGTVVSDNGKFGHGYDLLGKTGGCGLPML